MKRIRLSFSVLIALLAMLTVISCGGGGGGGGGGSVGNGSSGNNSGTENNSSTGGNNNSTNNNTPVPTGMIYVTGGIDRDGNSIPNLYVCDHEVTQYEYTMDYTATPAGAKCGYRLEPSTNYGLGTNYPVYYVSSYDAIIYCNLRSIAEGLTPCYSIDGDSDPKNWHILADLNGGIYATVYDASNNVIRHWKVDICISANGYRLPTWIEWQWLARGGTARETYTYAGSNTIDDVAWYYTNPGGKSHPVKGKQPNSLGLYDMTGNIMEICCYYDTNNLVKDRHVLGGSWNTNYAFSIISTGGATNPDARDMDVGFRVVRTAN